MGYPFFTCPGCDSTFDDDGKPIHLTVASEFCDAPHPDEVDDGEGVHEAFLQNLMAIAIQEGVVRGFLS